MDRDRSSTRLLDSCRSSDDLEALNTVEVDHLNQSRSRSPSMPFLDSVRSSDIPSLSEYKPRYSTQWDQLKTVYAKGRYFSSRRRLHLLGLAIFFMVALGVSFRYSPVTLNVIAKDRIPRTQWKKPKEFKIVGLVFYGRPQYVSILDCYLKKNLAINGGFLDEVQFAANTKNEFDLHYLDQLVNTTEYYKKIEIPRVGFGSIWEHAVDNNTMYIKIDDDIVYIHPDAIPRMVHTKLNHLDALGVAANIINSPITNWFHYRTNAVLPYLPEPISATALPANITNPVTWRASELPLYPHIPANEFDFGETTDESPHHSLGQVGGPPSENHRWLPLPPTAAHLAQTPIAKAEYNAFGRAWTSWAIAAQQHYSLLSRIETNTTHLYHFGDYEGVWNMRYDRYNLNFLAVWGGDVAIQLPTVDDERDFTVTNPKRLKRPLLVDTHALVAHFSFGPQVEVRTTDLLDRYRDLANELVCAADNQKQPVDRPDD